MILDLGLDFSGIRVVWLLSEAQMWYPKNTLKALGATNQLYPGYAVVATALQIRYIKGGVGVKLLHYSRDLGLQKVELFLAIISTVSTGQ